jgi:phage-related protein
MNVFDLFATLSLDTSEFDSALSGAETAAGSFGSSIAGGLATAGRIGATAVAATTAAVVAGSAAFVSGVSDVSEYADNIDKMSQKLGMSAEAYQEWDFITQHAGTSIESMQTGMRTLASAVETGNEAFQTLGFTEEQLAGMSQEELFGATIEALQNVEDTTQRTYLAGQLLGRGATELGPLLNMSAEEVEGMREQVHELGGVMSDEAVSAGANFQDSLQNMQTALAGVRNNLLGEFLPSFSTVMDGLAAIFSGDEGGLETVRQGVEDFASRMNETLPTFITLAGDILGVLGDALISNLPAIIDIGARVIEQLANGLISNLGPLMSAAVMLITRIGSSLIQALPDLARSAIQIITQLGQFLVDNAPQLISATTEVIITLAELLTDPESLQTMIELSLQLILAIAQGLTEAIPQLVEVIPVIIENVAIALYNSFPAILSTLSGLVESAITLVVEILTSGWTRMKNDASTQLCAVFSVITGALENIKAKFSEIFTGIFEAVTGKIDEIRSNITSGIENARDTAAGILDSIKQKFTDIFEGAKEIVSSAIDYIKGLFDFEWSLPDITLPHFNIEGGVAPYGLGGQGTFPSISVDWYAKAMSQPMVLDEAAIFGAANGHLLGGGEAGREMIYGHENLMNDITAAVSSVIGAGQPLVIPIYIGSEKLDEFMINSNQRTNYISGGRG